MEINEYRGFRNPFVFYFFFYSNRVRGVFCKTHLNPIALWSNDFENRDVFKHVCETSHVYASVRQMLMFCFFGMHVYNRIETPLSAALFNIRRQCDVDNWKTRASETMTYGRPSWTPKILTNHTPTFPLGGDNMSFLKLYTSHPSAQSGFEYVKSLAPSVIVIASPSLND